VGQGEREAVVISRRIPPRARHRAVKFNGREGFEFDGKWWSPDEIHAVCKARMDNLDKAPREIRDRVNSEGR
jgi:hypothetical protein